MHPYFCPFAIENGIIYGIITLGIYQLHFPIGGSNYV